MDVLIGLFGLGFVVVAGVLLALLPFFIYGISKRTKETSLGVAKTNKLLVEILGELRRGGETTDPKGD